MVRVISDGRAEPGHLPRGERADPGEDRRRGRRGRRPSRCARRSRRRSTEQAICTTVTPEHPAAGAQDVAGVPGGDAAVDDVGVEAGQVQRGHRRHQLQQHHRVQRARGRAAGGCAAGASARRHLRSSAARPAARPHRSRAGRSIPSRNSETISAGGRASAAGEPGMAHAPGVSSRSRRAASCGRAPQPVAVGLDQQGQGVGDHSGFLRGPVRRPAPARCAPATPAAADGVHQVGDPVDTLLQQQDGRDQPVRRSAERSTRPSSSTASGGRRRWRRRRRRGRPWSGRPGRSCPRQRRRPRRSAGC